MAKTISLRVLCLGQNNHRPICHKQCPGKMGSVDMNKADPMFNPQVSEYCTSTLDKRKHLIFVQTILIHQSHPNISKCQEHWTSLPAVDVLSFQDVNFPPSVSSLGATTRGPSVHSVLWTRAGQLRGGGDVDINAEAG